MAGVQGQKWKHRPGQKIHIGTRISEELNKKLIKFMKEKKFRSKSSTIEAIIKIVLD